MTSTNIQIGFGDNSKNSSKVLKPPGGGSSDLFGADASATPRSVKNRMQSNIFAAPEAKNYAEPGRRVQQHDSHNRLFGDVSRGQAPSKNHLKSTIPIGGGSDNGETHKNGHSMNGNGHKMNGDATDGSVSSNGNGHHAAANGNGHATNGGAKYENGHSNGIASKDSNVIIPDKSSNGSNNHTNNNAISNDNSTLSSLSTSSESTSSKSSFNNNNSNNINNSIHNTPSKAIPKSPTAAQRNPVTGNGMARMADRPQKFGVRRVDGNPVTGEGYKPAPAEINTTVPSLNGSNQVINKNRVPPGGFSSGLW